MSEETARNDDTADERMAKLLEGDRKSISRARESLRDSAGDESDDLLGRIAALDFVDSLVGQPGSELPERLGEYRITDLLGRGGMGTVFEAFQESLERSVALKVLSPSLTTDPRMRRRFRSEARASATLHHQHIVPVYGFGETAGYLYFTMERVDGVSLDKLIAQARASGELPDPRESARAFAGVADALGHAHRRGILHRDVKPGNILVHPTGEFALADFGLSKMLGDVSASLSRVGGFLGTLYYAAPEQAKGRDCGPATDLYSLGVTMFEHLTGRLPLEGRSTEAMLEAVLHGEPMRLRSLRPKAPKDLCAVLQKLLHKEPEDRYTDGEELARDLLRVADDEPVKIRRLPTLTRMWRQVRKHPGISAALTAVAILLIVVLWQWRLNVDAREQRMVTRHASLLSGALESIADEPGEPAGPSGLLESLTGLEVDRAGPSLAVREQLDAALSLVDDPQPTKVWLAYVEDPSAECTKRLRVGQGHAVFDELTERIDSLDRRVATRRFESSLELYRLLLARAVASLSASVGDPEAAAKDLFYAHILRRGALFPRMLLALVDWKPERGRGELLDALEALRDPSVPSLDPAIGALLISIARIEASPASNLMRFELDYATRRALHERGVELWGGRDRLRRALEGQVSVGLEARLRAHAVEASRHRSSPARLRDETRRGRDLLASDVAPGSSLESWGVTYDLLDGKTIGLLTDSPEAERQVRGINDYLDLREVRTDRQIRRLADGIDSWLLELPRSTEVARLRARLAELGGPSEDAWRAASDWMAVDLENPEVYLCRMRSGLHRDKDEVQFQAVLAKQYALDPDQVVGEIVTVLREAEVERPALRGLWRGFAER